jgi:adenylyltransferase/sulfurtransferase
VNVDFTDTQIERYSRHIILAEVGGKGQKKLASAKVLIIGAGGLGCPAALYLAAAGVGTIGLVDGDVVDLSNLQRQILHSTDTIGQPKVESGRRMLNAINPDVTVTPYPTNITADNIMKIVADYDIVLDGSDNFTTRYLVNDACFFAAKPLISGSIFRFEGQLTTLKPAEGFPCYRCLYAEPPPAGLVPNCQEAGVLGILAGTIGTLQAAECLKEIIGAGTSLAGSILMYDALEMTFRKTRVPKDPDCALCGTNPRIRDLSGNYEVSCAL